MDMGIKPAGKQISLERKDNEKPYSPGNCVWATNTVQSRNRRCSKLTIADVARIRSLAAIHTRTELARQYGVSIALVSEIVLRKKWK